MNTQEKNTPKNNTQEELNEYESEAVEAFERAIRERWLI